METSAEQFGTLSLGALKRRALALGVAVHDVDSLDGAENPVEAARDLVRGAEAQAAAAAAAEQIVLSEEDLGKLTLRSLKERAQALGAGAGVLGSARLVGLGCVGEQPVADAARSDVPLPWQLMQLGPSEVGVGRGC